MWLNKVLGQGTEESSEHRHRYAMFLAAILTMAMGVAMGVAMLVMLLIL